MDHDHAHTNAAPSAGASASVPQSEPSATSEDIQILKVSIYGSRDTQMTCSSGRSDRSARDELYRIGSGEDAMEVDAVFHWDTLLLSLTEPFTVPGTDFVASEVQLDMWEDEQEEHAVIQGGVKASILTENGPLLAPLDIRTKVDVEFFQHVADGSSYGVPGPVCRQLSRSGCTVFGPVQTLLEGRQGFHNAAGNLIIAVPVCPEGLAGQTQQSEQPAQSESSGVQEDSGTSTTPSDRQSWTHIPISYLFEYDYCSIRLDEESSGRLGRIRRYPSVTKYVCTTREGDSEDEEEYRTEWTSDGGELIALYPLHLTPFPEALSDSADDVDMEVDGPAAPASFAEFEAGGSPGV